MVKQIIDIYEGVFQKTQSDPDFKVKNTKRNTGFVESFLSLLNKKYGLDSIGEDFLFDYTVFQFEYYKDMKTARRVQLNWIYGKKALERWESKDENFLYWNRMYCQKYGIKKTITECFDEDMSEYINRERKRFYGTGNGFLNCKIKELNTDPKSKVCRFCKFKTECYEH